MSGRSPEEAEIPEVREAYEQGKHRRYNLLFAVNGGAFAVAQLFFDTTDLDRDVSVRTFRTFLGNLTVSNATLLGDLQLWQLSLGMALFTMVIVLDIFMFGQNMRRIQNMREKRPELSLFGWQGKLVLILIGGLVVTGWTLVSFEGFLLLLLLIVYLDSIGMVYLLEQTEDERAESVAPSTPWYLRYPRRAIELSVGILILTASLVVAVVADVFML
jgi:hypothetical protein